MGRWKGYRPRLGLFRQVSALCGRCPWLYVGLAARHSPRHVHIADSVAVPKLVW